MAGNSNISKIILRVRPNPYYQWINNFIVGGWRVKDENGKWIKLTPENTKVRNPYYDETNPNSPLWLTMVMNHEHNGAK